MPQVLGFRLVRLVTRLDVGADALLCPASVEDVDELIRVVNGNRDHLSTWFTWVAG
jgi:hypothetical protein